MKDEVSELKEGFRLDFFTLRVVRHCPRLAREVVDTPSLAPSQVNLPLVQISLLSAEGLV